MKTKLAGLALALLFAASAPAAIVVELVSVTNSIVHPGKFTWTYEAFLDEGTLLLNDYFKIYDFSGYVDGSAREDTDTFIAVTDDFYADPPGTPANNAAIVNLTFVYFGGDLNESGPGRTSLGFFRAASDISLQTPGVFAWSANMMADEGNGTVAVPLPVPEPSAALPLLAAGFAFWFRRRS